MLLNVFGSDITSRREAERDSFSIPAVSDFFDPGIITVEHGRAFWFYTLQDFFLGEAYFLDTLKKLEMNGSDIGDHSHIRWSYSGQRSYLPRGAHGHLQNGHLMRVVQFKDGEWQTNQVVKVSLRFKDIECGGKERRAKLFGCCLTDASRNTDHFYSVFS